MTIQLTEAADFYRNGFYDCQGAIQDKPRTQRVVWRKDVTLKPYTGFYFYQKGGPPGTFVKRHVPGAGADRSYHWCCSPDWDFSDKGKP